MPISNCQQILDIDLINYINVIFYFKLNIQDFRVNYHELSNTNIKRPETTFPVGNAWNTNENGKLFTLKPDSCRWKKTENTNIT